MLHYLDRCRRGDGLLGVRCAAQTGGRQHQGEDTRRRQPGAGNGIGADATACGAASGPLR